MKQFILYTILFTISGLNTFGQIHPLTLEPDGDNKKATISEQIGIVKIGIAYSRPGVKGREGKLWNTAFAHYGFVDQGHGTSTAAPWRAGANENTTFSFSHPVRIEGKDLAAGTYGFFISLGEKESTLIFSKINNSWGSFYYDSTEDALRVTVKNQVSDQLVEWLKYEFTEETKNSAIISLSWEKRKIPFKVEADIEKLQIASFQSELRTTRPYYDFISAVNYCIKNNTELELALTWIDRATYFRVMGEKNFRTLSTKAALLRKMNRNEEAKKIMQEAIPLGSMNEIHQYGRILLSLKQPEEAMKIFTMNFKKYPDVYTTNIGMGRGYSATGDFPKAIRYMKAALKQVPDATTEMRTREMINLLEKEKDVNR
ncbi:MAG: DUF2911 domain-containing protein [Chitinophagaceae bacterium]